MTIDMLERPVLTNSQEFIDFVRFATEDDSIGWIHTMTMRWAGEWQDVESPNAWYECRLDTTVLHTPFDEPSAQRQVVHRREITSFPCDDEARATVFAFLDLFIAPDARTYLVEATISVERQRSIATGTFTLEGWRKEPAVDRHSEANALAPFSLSRF